MVSAAFAPVVGQTQAIRLLEQAVARQRVAPAYLFVGPSGVGRRLVARCFLELLTGASATAQPNHPDILWVEPSYLQQGKLVPRSVMLAQSDDLPKTPPQIRLEQIREIARFLSRPPLQTSRSLVVLEDAETMGEAAANGLLKTLEEPGRATLILIAPSADRLLPTLVSRCQRIPCRSLSTQQVQQVLAQSAYPELLQQPELMAMAQGSPGAAIANWQQQQAIPPELLQALQPLPSGLRAALELARQIDHDLSLEAQLWLTDYWQQQLWQQGYPARILSQLETVKRQLRGYAQPRLVWEVALMGMTPDCL